MPKCPHCEKNITFLYNKQSGIVQWKFYKNGTYSKRIVEMFPDDDINIWVCPECTRIIAETEEDALEFLRGGKK